MPIYEYVCTDCQHHHEALQSLSDAPLTECPACHKPTLQKRVSAAGFRFKGGGWYETDFKTDNQRNLADGGKKGSTSTDKNSESGSKGSSSGGNSTATSGKAGDGSSSSAASASSGSTSTGSSGSSSSTPS